MSPKIVIRFYFVFLLLFFVSFIAKAQSQKDSITYYKEKIKQKDSLPFDEAISSFQRLSKLVPREEKIRTLVKEAQFYADKKKPFLAKKTYLEALNLAEKENNQLLLGFVYLDLSSFYYNRMYQLPLAYKYSLYAQRILKKLNNQEKLNIVNTNLSLMLVELGEFDKADKLFKESLTYYINKNDSANIVFVSINMASLQQRKKKYNESNAILNTLLQEFSLEKIDKSLIYYNLAINKKEQKQYREAVKNVDFAISLSTEIEDVFQLSDLYFLKADIAIDNGEIKNALKLFQKSLDYAKEIKDTDFQKDILEKLIQGSTTVKDYTYLHVALKEYEKLKDSLVNQEKTESLEEIHLKSILDNKEVKIQSQKLDIERSNELNNLYLSVLLLSVFLFIALVAFFISYKKNNRRKLLLIEHNYKIKSIEEETKRKFELLKTKRIEEDIKAKKKELLLDLALAAKRVEKVELVLRKIDALSKKSIITKKDIVALKIFVEKKHQQSLLSEQFRKDMNQINQDFYAKVLADFPTLSNTELKVLSFLGVGLGTKEIANIQNVSVDAVRKTRYRIRKKMNLQPKESLEKFILKYQ